MMPIMINVHYPFDYMNILVQWRKIYVEKENVISAIIFSKMENLFSITFSFAKQVGLPMYTSTSIISLRLVDAASLIC